MARNARLSLTPARRSPVLHTTTGITTQLCISYSLLKYQKRGQQVRLCPTVSCTSTLKWCGKNSRLYLPVLFLIPTITLQSLCWWAPMSFCLPNPPSSSLWPTFSAPGQREASRVVHKFLSQRVITMKRHTNLASAVLVDKVVEFPDKNHGEAGNREAVSVWTM